MSDGEAQEVLAGQNDASRLIQQAAGWPAVLGLAALSDGGHNDSELSASLSDYFAQELDDAAEPGVQWGLCLARTRLSHHQTARRISVWRGDGTVDPRARDTHWRLNADGGGDA